MVYFLLLSIVYFRLLSTVFCVFSVVSFMFPRISIGLPSNVLALIVWRCFDFLRLNPSIIPITSYSPFLLMLCFFLALFCSTPNIASFALSMTSRFHWKYFSCLFHTLLKRNLLAISLSKFSKSTYGTSLSERYELTSLSSFSSKFYISSSSSGKARSRLSFSFILRFSRFVIRFGPQTAFILSVIPISSTLLG